jgi:Cytosol aminopeptidase family, N-terminal domain
LSDETAHDHLQRFAQPTVGYCDILQDSLTGRAFARELSRLKFNGRNSKILTNLDARMVTGTAFGVGSCPSSIIHTTSSSLRLTWSIVIRGEVWIRDGTQENSVKTCYKVRSSLFPFSWMLSAMRLTKGGSLRNGLAMAFASTQCVPSFFTHHLMATAFSLNVRPTSAGSRDFNTYRAMSKSDQTFTTWSFDEPCTTMAWTELVGTSLQVTSDTSLWDSDTDLIVVGVFAPKKDDAEDEADNKEKEPPTVELSGEAKVLDEKLGGALSAIMIENAKDFNHGAKAGSATPTLRTFSEGKSQRYIVVGLGKLPEGKADDLLGVGSALGKAIADKCSAEKGVVNAKVLLPKGLPVDASMLSDVSCSFYRSLYSDNRYRSGDKIKEPAKDLKTVTFVSEESTVADDAAAAALAAGKKIASGTHMAKDIVNCPHNVLNALGMADTAKRIAKESGGTVK